MSPRFPLEGGARSTIEAAVRAARRATVCTAVRGPRLMAMRVVVIVAAAVAAGCATAPQTAPPRWAVSPPEDDERYFYIVSSGDTRSIAAEKAAAALVERLSLGREADMEAEPVPEFRRRVVDAATGVRRPDRDAVEGLEVEEHAISRGEEETVHWLLVSFEREAFEEKRLELARTVPGANPGPPLLRRARERLREGDVLGALRVYGGAVEETRDTAHEDDVLERVAVEVEELLTRVELVADRGRIETRVGGDFERPFTVRVTDSREDRSIPGFPVEITYSDATEQNDPGIAGEADETVKADETHRLIRRSDEDGVVSFTPPVPRRRGSGAVAMAPAPFFDLTTPGRESEGLERLSRRARSRTVTLEYEAFSRATEIPTGVFIVDTDIAGNATGRLSTQRGLLAGFGEHGLPGGALPLNPRRFLDLGDTDRVDLTRQRFYQRYERAVLGTASITDFDESGSVSVEVTATVWVVELDDGAELYRTRMRQHSRGNNASAAITAAFRSLGQKLAADLVERLP
ncbi:MAG: hypothetical protein ACOCXE_04825 [Spirochaetota bacterium]